jgi:mRNA-degrading endonuclease RelE of RelBE toxin-antitoxin system
MFKIVYLPDAKEQLRAFKRSDAAVLEDQLAQQLQYQPLTDTRHNKQLHQNSLAARQLSIRHMRVLYNVDKTEQRVEIVAIGVKDRNRLLIAGQEIRLVEKSPHEVDPAE